MRKPEFITFTGVDDHTDPAGLMELASLYPIEWGILFSPDRQGVDPRYPKMSTIQKLVKQLPLRWAAHLCGADARAVIADGKSAHDRLLRAYFERSQINTADPKVQPTLVGTWARQLELRAILQCRGPFPDVCSTDLLFDASGGRGIVPSDWPQAVDFTFCGYAGGLRPENVAQALEIIGQRATRYWIDMETGVRDEQDRFSLEKCRAVCEAVYGKRVAQTPAQESDHRCPGCGAGSDKHTVEAVRESVPYGDAGKAVSVILPVHTCSACGLRWTDQSGEAIRDFAVREASAGAPAIDYASVRAVAEQKGLKFVSRSYGEYTADTVSIDTLVDIVRLIMSKHPGAAA